MDNIIVDPKTEKEKEEALQKLQILALIEKAIRDDLPWDAYLQNGLAGLGGLGYDDIMNQPRLLDRETRDDGRRYLMWRKIMG